MVFGNSLSSLQRQGIFTGSGYGDLFFETFVSTDVPEPGVFVLIISGLGTFLLRKRSRRG